MVSAQVRLSLICSLVLLGGVSLSCDSAERLEQVTTLTISMPAEASVEAGWDLVRIDVVIDGVAESFSPKAGVSSVKLVSKEKANVKVSAMAVQVVASESFDWHTATEEISLKGGANQLELSLTPLPTQPMEYIPYLYDETNEANIEWLKDFTIIFVQPETGYVAPAIYKTRDEFSMPNQLSLVTLFVDVDFYDNDIEPYIESILDIVGDLNQSSLQEVGTVAIEEPGGTSVSVSGLFGYDCEDTNGLVGYDCEDTNGRRTPLMAKSPDIPDDSVWDATAAEAAGGQVVLSSLEGFPDMGNQFVSECGVGAICSNVAEWQSCDLPFQVLETTKFSVRYEELPDLGCSSLEVRIPYNNSPDSCDAGMTCGPWGECECSEECLDLACGTGINCGRCGSCPEGEYCSSVDGTVQCLNECSGSNWTVPPKGMCFNGRFVYVCINGETSQYQCLDIDNDTYQCGLTANSYPVCVDTACSPACTDVMLGETDGCGNVCGLGLNGGGLPCSDQFQAYCHEGETPEIQAACTDDGIYSFPN